MEYLIIGLTDISTNELCDYDFYSPGIGGSPCNIKGGGPCLTASKAPTWSITLPTEDQ